MTLYKDKLNLLTGDIKLFCLDRRTFFTKRTFLEWLSTMFIIFLPLYIYSVRKNQSKDGEGYFLLIANERIQLAKTINDKELIDKNKLKLITLKNGLKQHIEKNPFLISDYVNNTKYRKEKAIQSGINYEKVLSKSEIKRAENTFFKMKELKVDNLPHSIDDFVKIKYNKNKERYTNLVNDYQDNKLRKNIKENYNLKVHEGKQGKHIKGHRNYKGNSYILDNLDVQKLINKYATTGDLKRDRKGKWTKKEFVNADEYIGYYVSEDESIQQLTKRFSISYSKNGVHIVPREEKKDGIH